MPSNSCKSSIKSPITECSSTPAPLSFTGHWRQNSPAHISKAECSSTPALSLSQAIRVMQDQPAGHIFNMDGAGADGNATPRMAAYGASKRSLAQLGKSLCAELNQVGLAGLDASIFPTLSLTLYTHTHVHTQHIRARTHTHTHTHTHTQTPYGDGLSQLRLF